MATVVLVVHQGHPDAAAYVRKATAWLAERGHTVRMPELEAAALGMAELGVGTGELVGPGPNRPGLADPEPVGPEPVNPELVNTVDLVVALGGDGTVLRAVRLVAERGLPVLGVNLGRLGFLTRVEPDDLTSALERFLAGDHSIEHRMMLSVSILRGPSPPRPLPGRPIPGNVVLALNEAVVEKPRPGSTVRLSAGIGGRPWTTYAGDGLIVATPTGSTAYSFSARGPIVSPTMRALVLTPVSAHMAFDRSLVVGEGEAVRVEVGDDRPAALTVDGRDLGLLRRGDAVVCRAADQVARFVRFGDRDFYSVLKAKFGVADR